MRPNLALRVPLRGSASSKQKDKESDTKGVAGVTERMEDLAGEVGDEREWREHGGQQAASSE